MTTTRVTTIAAGLAVPAAITVGEALGRPEPALALVIAALGVAWWRVPGFWRLAIRGVVAGALAGALILGPGYRLAMRVVALLEPVRPTELTLGGTAFIVVGIGVIFGGITAGWATLVARGAGLRRRGGVVLLTLATLVPLFSGSETRAELTDLGAGLWLNGPMFLAVTVLFAHVADRWARPRPVIRQSEQTAAQEWSYDDRAGADEVVQPV